MGMSVPPRIKEVKVNNGEIILTKSQYQNMFRGCSAITLGVAEHISPISEPISEPLSADGFDWRENERNAYEL